MSNAKAILQDLEHLVAFDTRNPPRAHTLDSPVFAWLREQLAGFQIDAWDHGDGSVTMLATRGRSDTLYNFHLDTVPVAEDWSQDPFSLRVTDEFAIGLGACDIKGALAAMLCACRDTEQPLALLITSDEEAGNSDCVREFLAQEPPYRSAIVAEPTRCKAVTSHRGVISGTVEFSGITGHASTPAALEGNAIHRAMRWGSQCFAAIEGSEPYEDTPLKDVRMNVGTIEGGVKPNMIAAKVALGFNLRTAPAQDQDTVIEFMRSLAVEGEMTRWHTRFQAPALPDDTRGEQAIEDAVAFAERNGLECVPAVDFWTEGALFSEAGIDAIVLGSGNLADAHTADEPVAIGELVGMYEIYRRLIEDGIK